MSFAPIAKPKSLLGYHRQLAPSAAVKVSPLCLGGMSFGTAWSQMMGSVDKKQTFEILDYFYEQGGNFVDTANGYQNEQSETWIGEWMSERNCRDEMVIATKFTTGYRSYEGTKIIQSNFGGNHAKSLKHSVDASLKKLKTDYIDLLWLHWWDYSTSVEEVMYALNDVVTSGKVIYLGISDTPAWIVAKANEFARSHHLRPFVVYQGRWSAATRDFEREIIPMTRAEGMGLCPWGALGGGSFKTKEQRESTEGRNRLRTEDNDIKMSEVLERIAKRKGTLITSVAMSYVMQKTGYVFPIIGCRTVKHLQGNIEALGLELDDKDMDEIEDAVPFDLGFPGNFGIQGKPSDRSGAVNAADIWLTRLFGHFDFVESEKPVKMGLHKDEKE